MKEESIYEEENLEYFPDFPGISYFLSKVFH